MPDLTALESARKAATDAVSAYSRALDARQRERYPDSPDWTGAGPDPEAALQRGRDVPEEEQAELERLRAAELDLVMQLHRARQAVEVSPGD